MLKVRAKGDKGRVFGYYDHIRRRGGDEFVLKDVSHFSARYMEELDKEAFAEARAAIAQAKGTLEKLGIEFGDNDTMKTLSALFEAAEKAAPIKKAATKNEGAVDREEVKAKLKELEVEFAGNLSTVKLVALLEAAEKAKAETDKDAGEGEGSESLVLNIKGDKE